ncbi:MAG: sulfatase-like hydrolase/transferase [Candidatus Sumerlaeia bacterium]
MTQKPLNILWITCDEMRASAVSNYGNGLIRMPAFERMAKEGVRFDQCHVQVPKCIPVRGQLLSGRYPHVDGLRTMSQRDFSEGSFMLLKKDSPSLLRWLKEQGYVIGLTGKNHLLDKADAAEVFEAIPPLRKARKPLYEERRPEWTRAYFGGRVSPDYDLDDYGDSVQVDRMIHFMGENRDRPFFGLCDIAEPHPPYKEWPGFADDIPLESVPLPPMHENLDTAPEPIRACRVAHELDDLTDEDRRRILRAYYSQCRYADRLVQRMLDALDEMGLAENTLVILGADHGDFAGTYGCYEKWDTALYDCITRVPLLMRLPGRLPADLTIEALVEGIDIAPTCLELLGMDVPSTVHGKSLMPLITGEKADVHDAVFSQGGVEPEAIKNPGQNYQEKILPEYYGKQQTLIQHPEALLRAHMVRTQTHKLIYRLSGSHELYDLVQDPDELQNVYGQGAYAEVQAALEARLLQFLVRYQNDRPFIEEIWA